MPPPIAATWIVRACLSVAAVVLAAGPGLRAQADGTGRWQYNVGGYITSSSPALSPSGGAIYIGVETGTRSGRLAALTPAGERLWEFERAQPIDSTPAVAADGTIYVGCVDGRLYALNPGTNETRIKWSVNAGGFVSSSPAIGPDGTIYFGSGDHQLHAVSASGVERWTFPTGGPIFSSAAVAGDGTIYIGSDDHSLYAVSPDGAEKWHFTAGGAFTFSSPAIGADGTVYIGSTDQRVYALAPDGTKRWEYFTNGAIDVSPALGADGTVYVASRDLNFYALRPTGPDEQRLKWVKGLGVTTASSPAVRGDGTIIFGADDNRVRALSPIDGSFRWTPFAGSQTEDDYMESSPIVAPDGSIYIGSSDGYLYKINGNGSPLSAASSWPAFRRDFTRSGRAQPAVGSGRLVNLSTRARIAGDGNLIAGFFVQGVSSKAYLVRGIGPSLSAFNVGGFMPDPRLQVFSGQVLLGQNDNWNVTGPGFGVADVIAGVGAFPLLNGSKDAATVMVFPSGAYTTQITSVDGTGGVVLAEVYDANTNELGAGLVNLSTRGRVGAAGEDNLFAGFYVDGTGPVRLLLRAVGPGLTQFGVAAPLARPAMTLFAQEAGGVRRPVRSNSGWTSEGLSYDLIAAANTVAAFQLPTGSADAAMVVTVNPGAYTMQISGVGGATGEALAEIYVLP